MVRDGHGGVTDAKRDNVGVRVFLQVRVTATADLGEEVASYGETCGDVVGGSRVAAAVMAARVGATTAGFGAYPACSLAKFGFLSTAIDTVWRAARSRSGRCQRSSEEIRWWW